MKYPDKNHTSAVPGTIAPVVDIEALRQRSIADTLAEIGKQPITIEAKDDGVDWARRILARLDAGENVGPYAERMAIEALATVVVIRQPGDDDG